MRVTCMRCVGSSPVLEPHQLRPFARESSFFSHGLHGNVMVDMALVVCHEYAYLARRFSYSEMGRVEEGWLIAGITAKGSTLQGAELAGLVAHAIVPTSAGSREMGQFCEAARYHATKQNSDLRYAQWGGVQREWTDLQFPEQELTLEALLRQGESALPIRRLAHLPNSQAYLVSTIPTQEGEYSPLMPDVAFSTGAALYALRQEGVNRVMIALPTIESLRTMARIQEAASNLTSGLSLAAIWIHRDITRVSLIVQ